MALVTVQRSPCGSNSNCHSPNTDNHDGLSAKEEKTADIKGISECYFAVKGAALVLPHDECLHIHRKTIANGACDIQQHLQAMLYLLHADDILKMAVKLESAHSGRTRYLVVMEHPGSGGVFREESCLLGIDCNNETTIGLLLPITLDTRITLDGDGGFSVTSNGRHHIFKPVSVQAMWSALQTLHKAGSKAREHNHFKCGGTHQWIQYYEKRINSDRSCLNEWHAMDDIESKRPPSPDTVRLQPTERQETERHIRTKLKELMMSVDLDEVTSKYIRTRLEEILDMDLKEYKPFIDQEMLTILGQMDAPTEIFQYLYLGSEWNASNLEELVLNGIGHILNVTREIDNFFPGMFDYQNIRVYDDESTEILHYWDKTYRYIRRAKDEGSKVLVHCKMGISRSASVVIAYVMKAYDWDLQRALEFVKTKRGCIKPNSGFLKQLEIYQGILDASKQRHNSLWRSKSETNLKCCEKPKKKSQEEKKEKVPEKSESLHHLVVGGGISSRPKSWSPSDVVADLLFSQDVCGENPKVNQSNKHILNKSPKILPNSSFSSLGSVTSDNCDGKKGIETLPRVSSIKDRINELELQVISSDKIKCEVKSPTSQSKSGLVFNLANQFEAGSKPSSPVDEGLVMKASMEEVVQPVTSQMKPPASKHQAILVKPSLWPEDQKSVSVSTKGLEKIDPSEDWDGKGISGKQVQKIQSEEKTKSNKTSHVLINPVCKNVSNPTNVQFKEDKTDMVSNCCQSFQVSYASEIKTADPSISTYSVNKSSDSYPNVKDINKVSQSLPHKSTVKTQSATPASKPAVRLHTVASANHPDNSICIPKTNHLYEKEDIPFTPGKVMRTKQKIEERNLTRATSFDSGFSFKTRSMPSTPPDTDFGTIKLIRRSHSLRNDRKSAIPFCGKWYPLPALASSVPHAAKNQSCYQETNNASLSISTPSVVEAVNKVICGTQEILACAIQFIPIEKKSSSIGSSSDSDLEFGSASSLPEIDAKSNMICRSPPTERESPVPGLVRLQREILENKATKSSDKSATELTKVKKDATKPPSSNERAFLVTSDASKCNDLMESGIVKRLKMELEAKSTPEVCRKERNEIPTSLERQILESAVENPLCRFQPLCFGTRVTHNEIKGPPTPHRKASLDLTFIQKKFPLNFKLTAPTIRPNSRVTMALDHRPNSSPNDLLPAITCSPCIPPVALPRKLRKQQGSTHPLSKLIKQRHPNPLYNTM